MKDKIKRWMAADGRFRVLAAQSTEMVSEAAQVSGASGDVLDLYGRLLIGTALMQLAQAPIDRVQAVLASKGAMSRAVADIRPGVMVRGYVAEPSGGDDLLGGRAQVEVTRQLARSEKVYQSVVPIAEGSVANALQQYLLESEQVLSFLSLTVIPRQGGGVERAGGMLIQALPGAKHEHLKLITECLESESFDDLVAGGMEPLDAAEKAMAGAGLQHVGDDPLVYRCGCSKAAAVAAVKMLDDDEIEQINQGEGQEVRCDFCGSEFIVGAADLEDEEG